VRVLVVGGGGREHALCWALARSTAVFCAPGNPGTAECATNLDIPADQGAALVAAIRARRIDLTVIGPEAPLAAGLADRIAEAGFAVFGPSASAARIEASKAWAKDLMARAGVPTAPARSFTDREAALAYIATHAEPLVVKASGLAAGKGAVVCETRARAAETAAAMLAGGLGPAGREIVVEAFLRGEELSVLALTDGDQVRILPPSQDHKRLGDGDTGPNTGGMGAYAPVSPATPDLLRRVRGEVLEPVLRQMAAEGTPYRGVLYAGLMISDAGDPNVVEFNCRFGDPETQAIVPIMTDDLATDLWAIGSGEPWRPAGSVAESRGAAVTTILAAPGYPNAPRKGAAVTIPDRLPADTLLFHAGTTRDASGTLRTAGGRVLCATGLGPDVPAARSASVRLAEAIDFEGKVFRRDIAWREVARAGAA